MSSTSIQDQGYTPSDFLQKLFKRSSTASNQNHYTPLSTISNTFIPTPSSNSNSSSHHYYYPSTPIIPYNSTTQPKSSPSKLLRAHSLTLSQDERISTKKFKIFYNTIMQGMMPELDMHQLWQKFEKSLGNPFQYDRVIEDIRVMKNQQKQHEKQKQQNHNNSKHTKYSAIQQHIKQQNTKKQSKSTQKQNKKQTNINKWKRCTSSQKIQKPEQNNIQQRQKMKQTINYMRGIIKHGLRYLKER